MRYSLAATALALSVCLTGCDLFAPELNMEESEKYFVDTSDMLNGIIKPNRQDCRKFKFLLENRHTKTTEAALRRVAFDITTGSKNFFLDCKISPTERAYYITTASEHIDWFKMDEVILLVNIDALDKVKEDFKGSDTFATSDSYKLLYTKYLAKLGNSSAVHSYVKHLETENKKDEIIEVYRKAAINGDSASNTALIEKYGLLLLDDGTLKAVTQSDIENVTYRDYGIEVKNPKSVLLGKEARYKFKRFVYVTQHTSIRRSPSLASTYISQLGKGEQIAVYGQTDNWLMISATEADGDMWVLKAHTTKEKPNRSADQPTQSFRQDKFIPSGTHRISFQKCKANIFRAANERRVKPVIKIDTSLMYLARIPVAKNNYKEYDSVICSQPDGNMTVTRTRL